MLGDHLTDPLFFRATESASIDISLLHIPNIWKSTIVVFHWSKVLKSGSSFEDWYVFAPWYVVALKRHWWELRYEGLEIKNEFTSWSGVRPGCRTRCPRRRSRRCRRGRAQSRRWGRSSGPGPPSWPTGARRSCTQSQRGRLKKIYFPTIL